MKGLASFAVIFVLFIAKEIEAGGTEMPPEFLAIISTCKAETGASDADMAAMISHQPATTMEGKCIKACITRALNLLGDDGKINKDIAMKLVKIHMKGDTVKLKIAEEILDACLNIPIPENICEVAEQYGACILAETTKRGLQVSDF